MTVEFRNATSKDFQSLESEEYRIYTFDEGREVRIDQPLKINTGPGGHRVFDAAGISHYIPKGWIHLQWKVKDGKPHFDF